MFRCDQSALLFSEPVRDTFCSYGVMELCTRGLGTSIQTLRAKGVNLTCVRTLCVIAEERPRIHLTTSFSKLFSGLGLSQRAVSTSFGCRVNVGICLQVSRKNIDLFLYLIFLYLQMVFFEFGIEIYRLALNRMEF